MHVFDVYNNEIAYYTTPKCGSRTILAWAALIKEPDLIHKYPSWFEESRQSIEYKDIRQRVKKYELLKHDQKIRFCVIRDPVERFLSAFTNRILFHKKPNVDITITDFIDNFNNLMQQKIYKDAQIHFTTQAHYIGKDPNLYTHIIDIKELNKLKILLENHTNTKLPDLHLQKSGPIEKPILTEDQVQWIKNKYSIDYEVYGKWLK